MSGGNAADGPTRAQARPDTVPSGVPSQAPALGGPRPGERYTPVTGLPPVAEAEMFRSIAASSPDGVVAADADGTIVWANDAAAAMFGRDPGRGPPRAGAWLGTPLGTVSGRA